MMTQPLHPACPSDRRVLSRAKQVPRLGRPHRPQHLAGVGPQDRRPVQRDRGAQVGRGPDPMHLLLGRRQVAGKEEREEGDEADAVGCREAGHGDAPARGGGDRKAVRGVTARQHGRSLAIQLGVRVAKPVQDGRVPKGRPVRHGDLFDPEVVFHVLGQVFEGKRDGSALGQRFPVARRTGDLRAGVQGEPPIGERVVRHRCDDDRGLAELGDGLDHARVGGGRRRVQQELAVAPDHGRAVGRSQRHVVLEHVQVVGHLAGHGRVAPQPEEAPDGLRQRDAEQRGREPEDERRAPGRAERRPALADRRLRLGLVRRRERALFLFGGGGHDSGEADGRGRFGRNPPSVGPIFRRSLAA
ncbi:hypothetical protein DFJ74DRAFT_402890 [Hyaloraphidium curvatum]|nr:hypothetical protein DFJ74DRAFT_402890 [Hyaloraphidium curvatum]